jgi:hypothetical protein
MMIMMMIMIMIMIMIIIIIIIIIIISRMDKIFTLLDYGPSSALCYRRFGEISRDKQSKNCSALKTGPLCRSETSVKHYQRPRIIQKNEGLNIKCGESV